MSETDTVCDKGGDTVCDKGGDTVCDKGGDKVCDKVGDTVCDKVCDKVGDQGTSAQATTRQVMYATDEEVVEALVWISATSKPTWMYQQKLVIDETDVLIPENPVYYLWLQACHELNLLVVPLVPRLERPAEPVESEHIGRYMGQASRLNLSTMLLLEEGSTWQECFLAQTNMVLSHMRSIIERSNFNPMLSFYSKHTKDLAKDLEQLDFSLLMALVNKPDALFTSSAIAAEYIANDLGKGAIPRTVEERLSQPIDQYDVIAHDTIEVGLIVPNRRFSSKLIPMQLYAQRNGHSLPTLSMEEYVAECAVPQSLVRDNEPMARHLSSIVQMLVRESMLPRAHELFAWKQQADKIVSLATMLTKPVDNCLVRRVKSGHETPQASEHVLLLPSFKQFLLDVLEARATGPVWATRLEWDSTSKRMAYCLYLVEATRVDRAYVEQLKEMPWHDRWSFFTAHPWTRDAIQWIRPNVHDEGINFVSPVSLGAASQFARIAWWVERQLRITMGVRTTDIHVDFDPHLGAVCASFLVPKSVEISPEWVVDWKQLQ